MENYLITGYWGEPHVTAENDRGLNAAIFGAGKYVLPVGKQFKAEFIGNRTVRIYDGKLLDNGALAGIPAGKYVDVQIPEAGQNMNRNDMIVFQYSQDNATLIETGVFTVVTGTETSGTASDPVLTEDDLTYDEATFDQMPLWRVPVSGAAVSTPEPVFQVRFAGERLATAHSANGSAYTAQLPGVPVLYNGLSLTVIPDKTSTQTAITLDLNGLGTKAIRMMGDSGNGVSPYSSGWLVANRPYTLRYDEASGIWITDIQRPAPSQLNGTVPIAKGGTGATTAEAARTAIGAAAATHTHSASDVGAAPSSHNHSTSNITSGTLPIARGGTGASSASAARTALGAAPAYSYGTDDLTAGSSSLETGKLHFVYE